MKTYQSIGEAILDDHAFYEQFKAEKRFFDIYIRGLQFEIEFCGKSYDKSDLIRFINANLSEIIKYVIRIYGTLITDEEMNNINKTFSATRRSHILLFTDTMLDSRFVKLIRHVLLYDMFLGSVIGSLYKTDDRSIHEIELALTEFILKFESDRSEDRIYYMLDYDAKKIYRLGNIDEAPYYFKHAVEMDQEFTDTDNMMRIFSNNSISFDDIKMLIDHGCKIEYLDEFVYGDHGNHPQSLRTKFDLISKMGSHGAKFLASDLSYYLDDTVFKIKLGYHGKIYSHICRANGAASDVFLKSDEMISLGDIDKDSVVGITTVYSNSLSKEYTIVYLSTNNNIQIPDLIPPFTQFVYLTDGLLEFPYNKEEK